MMEQPENNNTNNTTLINTSIDLLSYCHGILNKYLLLDYQKDKKRREAEQCIRKALELLKDIQKK